MTGIDPFEEARENINGALLLRRLDSEMLGLDPRDQLDVRRVHELCRLLSHAQAALDIAEHVRYDAEDAQSRREIYQMLMRDFRTLVADIADAGSR